MGELNLTRRAFTKLAAVTGAAVACTAAAPNAALAEDAGAAARGDDVKRVRTCCRGCGKMECGVWVTVQNGRAVKVEGDQSSFQSSGNCCGKSQSSIQAAYHPDRIYHPMKRTNPKGEDPGWQRITWDEAMQTIGEKFQQIIDRYGGQSIFNMAGTSRQWVYGPYAFYKWLFDTPNAHVASEICKGPRRLMGWISSVDGAPWMALRDGPRVYVQWGTAPENSNYDDSCRNLVDKMNEADVHICIDPRLSGSGKEADYWLNLKPGTDGALALCWQHIIIEHDLVDWEFVKRWTDASLLVVEDMGAYGRPLHRPVIACPSAAFGGPHRHEAEDPSSEGERPERGRQPPQVLCVEQERQRRRGRPGVLGRRCHAMGRLQPRRPHARSDGSRVQGNVAGRLSSPAVLLGAGGGRHRLRSEGDARDRAGRRHEARCQARVGLPGGIREGVHYGVVPGEDGPRSGARGGGVPRVGDAS